MFLYPATHNYTPLDIVNENVSELNHFKSLDNEVVELNEHISILGFVGTDPKGQITALLNLKELVYDKFKGFKKFQMVMLVPEGYEKDIKAVLSEISSYEDLKFWYFVFGEPEDIKEIHKSLKSSKELRPNLSTDAVFIIDKDLYQRGRIDDRTDDEIEKKKNVYGLFEYDCIEVAEIKNKMSEDLRILFTEYRQRRKGEFNSDVRRVNDLKEQTN
jgi:hypothetical protein